MRNKILEVVLYTLYDFYQKRTNIALFQSRSVAGFFLDIILLNIYIIIRDVLGFKNFLAFENNYVLIILSLVLSSCYVYFSTKKFDKSISNRLASTKHIRTKGIIYLAVLFFISIPLFFLLILLK